MRRMDAGFGWKMGKEESDESYTYRKGANHEIERMSVPFVPQVGAVLSADIAVPEHEREMRFYSRVLRTGEDPLWREDMISNVGVPIIGLGARGPQYADLPLQWMPHIQVADVATSARRTIDLGGAELMHARNADGKSQWAVLADPNGAAFGLIPTVPVEAIPRIPDDVPSVGKIAWLDLTVPDAAATRDFYRQVVGWSVHDIEMNDGDDRYADYEMLAADGTAVAGVCHARGANLGLPPVWMIYLPVGDIAESLRRVAEEGGKVVKEARGEEGKHLYAAIRDPVGVHLALVPAYPHDRDRRG